MIILDITEAAEIVAERQSRNERVVFTNGVFDIVHSGHLQYLTEARALGDALMIAVNSDASVSRLKGPLRPIMPETERAALLNALRFVDYVTIFHTDTPVHIIDAIKPAVYVKGGDYRLEDLPEVQVVRSYGGDIQILSLVTGRSTSQIIEKICKSYCPEPLEIRGAVH